MKHVRFRPLVNRSGVALIIVLSLLVLLAGLCVGFLTRTGTEISASSEYHSAATARQLADTCVSLVQGQINLATSQGSNVAWASQPGMVSTFDVSGNLQTAYKLYSAAAMISSASTIVNGRSADEPPETWSMDGAIWTDLNAPVEVGGVKNYPILNPQTTTEGYSLVSGSAPGGTPYQPIPMPVRWLYILKDGRMIAPDGAKNTATISGATSASGTNPIVGRIAFWTDDDTCKVNINTSSEGTFWDTPHVNSSFDYNLASYQPAQKEFQRYPGHPATTSLSTVFPTLTAEQIYSIVPRVVGGGSKGGTAIPPSALAPDTDRLYANEDELLFTSTRNETAASSPLTKSQVEQSRFFITAHSRAPETNLFNLPRIAVWPIYKLGATGNADLTRTTAFDRLIAFCSSSGRPGQANWAPYIFQRENPASLTNDISIDRNSKLYDYLDYLTSHPIPGFGQDFFAKYGEDRDQILTEIFDYIRATNLQDSSQPGITPFTTAASLPLDVTKLPYGYGSVVPSKKGATLGMGRSYSLSQLALVFICNADGTCAASNVPPTTSGSVPAGASAANRVFANGESPLASGEQYIQAMALPEFFSPLQGFVYMVPDISVTISGLDTLTINGQSIFPSIPDVNVLDPAANSEVNRLGGSPGYRFSVYNKGSPQRGNLPDDGSSSSRYPFIGTPIRIQKNSGTMAFNGGTITVKVYAGHSSSASSSDLIQTFTITFPSGNFPVPVIVPDGVDVTYSSQANKGGPTNTAYNWWSFSKKGCMIPSVSGNDTNAGTSGRLNLVNWKVFSYDKASTTLAGSKYYAGVFLRPEYDTVRAMGPAHGDFRLTTASQTVSSFVQHPDYADSSKRLAADFCRYGILEGALWKENGTLRPLTNVGGKYISTVTYSFSSNPDIPRGATGANSPEGTGDYDNGIANMLDGPYANKADEGDSGVSKYGSYTPYFNTLNTSAYQYGDVGPTLFSPNRQIPSPGMLGSLPTGVKTNVPWRTLLFRPQPSHFGATSPADHLLLDLFWMPVVEPYAISDRFSTAGKINLNYQIQPFTYIERSTGLRALFKSEKVTAIPIESGEYYKGNVGVLGSGKYGSHANDQYRFSIDSEQTLSQFKKRFADGKLFKSASEICDIHIVPQGTSLDEIKDFNNFWKKHALTGDNSRERIYTTLYPRMTTKSNTYTVHYCVQALRPLKTSEAGTWTEKRDKILAEYRGATTIERFINVDAEIPDYASNPSSLGSTDTQTLDRFYKWRVISNRQFCP